MLSPMIDMIFLLLVFFILSTMYMTEVKTVPVRLPAATKAQSQSTVEFIVTIKKDNSYWLGKEQMAKAALLAQAKKAMAVNKDFTVIIRGDKDTNYNNVITLLDAFKQEGILRVGLATEQSVAAQ